MESPHNLYSTIMEMLAEDPENSSRIAELVVNALKEGESLRDIMDMLSELDATSTRYYLLGRDKEWLGTSKGRVIQLIILRIAQFILDEGESLIDLVDNLTRIRFHTIRAEIVAMYLGYDLFAEYSADHNLVNNVLVAAYSVSYERLLRVIGFYLKHGYDCIYLLYKILPEYLYMHAMRSRAPNKVELLIANVIVTECGESFENLMTQAAENGYEVVIEYLENYASSGV